MADILKEHVKNMCKEAESAVEETPANSPFEVGWQNDFNGF